ncbi:unnamed protein product, partial [marine sediment metagenome]
ISFNWKHEEGRLSDGAVSNLMCQNPITIY